MPVKDIFQLMQARLNRCRHVHVNCTPHLVEETSYCNECRSMAKAYSLELPR